MAPESSNHIRASYALYRISTIDESSSERTSPDQDLVTLISLPIGEWFESDDIEFQLNLHSLPFLTDHQSTMLWLTFL